MRLTDVLVKVRQYAVSNPDKTRQVFDKVTRTVDARTGGKYHDKIIKAGQVAQDRLGVPRTGTGTGTTPQPGSSLPQQDQSFPQNGGLGG